MTLNGYLSDFSLGEIFQVIEQGEKTGLLSIRDLFNHNSPKHYLWFRQGRVIAAANRLDEKGLPLLIQKQGWLSDTTYHQLYQLWPGVTPLGLHLKSQGALNCDQIRLLFVTQVMQQVCTLFKLDQGFFQFEANHQPSVAEMTGLSKPATELTLVGLRMLKNWAPLQAKLPAPSSGLISLLHTQPSYSLNQKEWQVWEYTKGTTALSTIATDLQLPLETIQKIAFRLIVISLAEELPMVEMIPPQPDTEQPENDPTPAVSHSFLDQLTIFLQGKT